MPEVREPQKQTSIDKKRRIIDAGLKLISEKGYFATNTAEIAKEAGVSTGIVYQYFYDKKDILVHAVKLYFDKIFEPIEQNLKTIKDISNMDDALKSLILASIEAHRRNSLAHEEIVAMSHIDEDIHNLFIESEHKIVDRILVFFENMNYLYM